MDIREVFDDLTDRMFCIADIAFDGCRRTIDDGGFDEALLAAHKTELDRLIESRLQSNDTAFLADMALGREEYEALCFRLYFARQKAASAANALPAIERGDKRRLLQICIDAIKGENVHRPTPSTSQSR